jgi:tetratricopeptide (TPR) repeat protein
VVHDSLADSLLQSGDFDEAEETALRGLPICRDLRDRFGEGWLLHTLGEIYREIGQFDESLAYLEAAVELRRQIQTKLHVGYSLQALAVLYHYWDQQDMAVQLAAEALARGRELAGPALQIVALICRAQAQAAMGRLDDARADYDLALSIASGRSSLHAQMRGLAGLAQIALQRDDMDLLNSYAGALTNALARGSELSTKAEPARLFLVYAQVLARIGQAGQAADIADRGREFLVERASRIADAKRRQSYLERIPAHRELFAFVADGG